jgi:hypothetical protein
MHHSPTLSPRGLRLALLLLLMGVVGLCACAKKKKHAAPPAKTPEWHGLRIGMPQKQAVKKLKDAGLRVYCAPAQNMTYLDGKTLYTRWVKKGQEKRVVRCKARRKKGGKPGQDGVLQSKLYFLDGTLYRLHVKMLLTDLVFEKVLTKRYGTLRPQPIVRHAYAGKKGTAVRMWTLVIKSTQLIWLRSGHHQQLVLFTTKPERVKALKALSTTRKGE